MIVLPEQAQDEDQVAAPASQQTARQIEAVQAVDVLILVALVTPLPESAEILTEECAFCFNSKIR